jgi:DNA ligase-1
LRPEARRIKVT